MKTWNDCVLEAKDLIRNMKSDRLKVARLALLATKLPGTDMTVARFAKEISVETVTLKKWIAAYEEYRIKHPVKEPEEKDYKPAAKSAKEKQDAEKATKPKSNAGRPVVHITIKSKSFLNDVNNLKERLKLKGEAKAMDKGVRTELIVKLREIADLLEKAN